MKKNERNAGIRSGLFESKHYARMGNAIWLFGWLVNRQSRQQGNVGFVNHGNPIRYSAIERATGFQRDTLKKWMLVLKREGYIRMERVMEGRACVGCRIMILNAKKFSPKQLGLPSGGVGPNLTPGWGTECPQGGVQNGTINTKRHSKETLESSSDDDLLSLLPVVRSEFPSLVIEEWFFLWACDRIRERAHSPPMTRDYWLVSLRRLIPNAEAEYAGWMRRIEAEREARAGHNYAQEQLDRARRAN